MTKTEKIQGLMDEISEMCDFRDDDAVFAMIRDMIDLGYTDDEIVEDVFSMIDAERL
jgi:hypothetical protein